MSPLRNAYNLKGTEKHKEDNAMVTTAFMSDAGVRHRLAGGIVPDSPWEPKKEEPSFEEQFREWREAVSQIKEVAASRLYDSEGEICLGDLWMHRFRISEFICDLQMLMVKHFGNNMGLPFDTPLPALEEAEKEITALVDLLHQWHGSPETQADLPEEFLKSMDEALSGKTEDFDHGFHARLAAAK